MSESKISDELTAIIRDKIETSPDEEIRVIVTTSEGAALEDAKNELVKIGLRIENVIPGPIQVIAGSISVKDISRLEKASEVKRIEYDSKVYAL